MEKSFLFQLSNTLEYSKDGGFAETATLEFLPPSMDSLDESTEFDQLVMGAMMSAGKLAPINRDADPNKKTENPSASDIKVILFASQDVKFKNVASSFKILSQKVAKLDDKTFMKKDLFNRVDLEDFKNMISEYAANFTFPSLLKEE